MDRLRFFCLAGLTAMLMIAVAVVAPPTVAQSPDRDLTSTHNRSADRLTQTAIADQLHLTTALRKTEPVTKNQKNILHPISTQPQKQAQMQSAVTGTIGFNTASPLHQANPQVNQQAKGLTPLPAPSRQIAQAVILDETGELAPGDEVMESDNSLFDTYVIRGEAGQNIAISALSDVFDTYLLLVDEDGNTIAENDDENETSTNSLISTTLPRSGTYVIVVNGYDQDSQGRYRVVAVTDNANATNPEPPVVTSFNCNGASSCTVYEGDSDYLVFTFEDKNGNANRWAINDFTSDITPTAFGATVRPGISCSCPDGSGQCNVPVTTTYTLTVSDTTGRNSTPRSVTVTCSP